MASSPTLFDSNDPIGTFSRRLSLTRRHRPRSQYPFGLFSTRIVDIITGGSDKLSTVFVWGVVINAFYLPGTFVGALMVDWIGPKKQLILFLCLQGVTGSV